MQPSPRRADDVLILIQSVRNGLFQSSSGCLLLHIPVARSTALPLWQDTPYNCIHSTCLAKPSVCCCCVREIGTPPNGSYSHFTGSLYALDSCLYSEKNMNGGIWHLQLLKQGSPVRTVPIISLNFINKSDTSAPCGPSLWFLDLQEYHTILW